MRICFLTQTASDISDYYKAFFAKEDIFFLTFKSENDKAIAYLPKSSWSDGRNKLWSEVKDKYDYYVFMDDDLLFFNFKESVSLSPLLAYAYHKLMSPDFSACYKQSKPDYFLKKLKQYLANYKPEVMSVTSVDWLEITKFDTNAMRKNSFVRRMGYFDAQFTVFSNYAANKILPYDTKISGWWSAQIPVYLYAHEVFASKSISVSEIGVSNAFHVGAYVPDYNGLLDCKKMIQEICNATNRDYHSLANASEELPVNFEYGKDNILEKMPSRADKENYLDNFNKKVSGIEMFMHENAEIK